MFPDIRSRLVHQITLWRRVTEDLGASSFEAPVQMAGRWREVSETFQDALGHERVSRAKVMVEDPVTPGDFLYWGDSQELDPRNVQGAYVVKQFHMTPNLRGNVLLKTAYL